MSTNADSKPGAAGANGTAAAGGKAGLLVAVEPPGVGGAAGGNALVAEGARIAREFGAEPRYVTWPSGPDIDLATLAAALAELAARARPAAVVLADTDVGRQLAPMIAHRLGSGAVVGCSDVLVRSEADGSRGPGPAALVFVKPVYGGWLEREIEGGAGTIPIATLDLTGLEEAESLPDTTTVVEVAESGAPKRRPVRRIDLFPPDARSVDLVHAKRIVAAGSGSASDRLLAAVGELADLLEGSVGATRPVVDDGLLPKERLIGQTGKTVTPDLYLALGISGSPHHVAGVKKAERVISVNRDVRAPIFQFSDVGYVADLEEVLPALVQKIKEWRDARD